MISLSLLVLILYWSVYSSLSIQHTIIIPNLYWSSLVYGISLHCVNLSRNASNYKHTNKLQFVVCYWMSLLYSALTTLNRLLFCRSFIFLNIFFKLIFPGFSFFTVIIDSIYLYCCQLLMCVCIYRLLNVHILSISVSFFFKSLG